MAYHCKRCGMDLRDGESMRMDKRGHPFCSSCYYTCRGPRPAPDQVRLVDQLRKPLEIEVRAYWTLAAVLLGVLLAWVLG